MAILADLSTGVSSVLVVVAHPDDAEFQFGGTVGVCGALGVPVHYLVCTSGELGSEARHSSNQTIAALRQSEQREAARTLGVNSVEFLDLLDSQVTASVPLRLAIARKIRQVRPQLVLTHFAERSYEFPIGASHPDHLAVGEACLSAVYPDARSTRSVPELQDLEPHVVAEVWVPALSRAQVGVDVSGQAERKLEALLCHRSQHGESPRESVAWVEERMKAMGERFGVSRAEAFFSIPTVSASPILRR